MPRVALTDDQSAKYEVDALCKSVLENIEHTFTVKKRMSKSETAEALGLHPNTWANWRTNNLASGVGFRDVATALRKAGYRIKIEAR